MKTTATAPPPIAEEPLRPISSRVSVETYRWLQGEQSKHYVETGSKLPISGVVRMLLERMQGKAGRGPIRRVK